MGSDSSISNNGHLFTIYEQETILLVRSHNSSDNPDDDTPANLYELARILTILDYNVKIISCEKYDESSPWILKIAQWIPKSIFGLFKTAFAVTKLFFVASQILMYKKTLNPIIVVVEDLTFIIPLLKIFGDIKIMYIEDVLKNMPILDQLDDYRHRNRRHQLYYLKFVQKVVVSCITSKLVLENEILNINKRPILLYPNIETPEFLEERYIPVSNILNALDQNSVIILTFGDFIPENNFDFAIDCFKRLQRKFRNHRYLYDNMHLVICGTCKNREHLNYMKQLMNARKNSENVIFIRNMPYLLRKALLKVARCVIFPSVIYNHDQMVLMQCLMMGKIVIATQCDVTNDLMQHESNGYICDATVNAFVFYMAKIITDPFARKSLEATIKNLFSDYYGESQYITAVKSIFENLDTSEDIPEPEHMLFSNDLSVMENSYFIYDIHNNIWALEPEENEPRKDVSIELVPIPQINQIPVVGDCNNFDDNIEFLPDEDQFISEINMDSSTPVKNSSNWEQFELAAQNFDSPSFFIINNDEQRPLFAIQEENGEESDTDEDSFNQTTLTKPQTGKGITSTDVLKESSVEPDTLPNYFTPNNVGEETFKQSTLYAIKEEDRGENDSDEDFLNQSSFTRTQAEEEVSDIKVGEWSCSGVQGLKKLAEEIGGLILLEENNEEVIVKDSVSSETDELFILLKPHEIRAYKHALSEILNKSEIGKEAAEGSFEDINDDSKLREEHSSNLDKDGNEIEDDEILEDSWENSDEDSDLEEEYLTKVDEVEDEKEIFEESSGESIHQYSETSEDYSPNKTVSTESDDREIEEIKLFEFIEEVKTEDTNGELNPSLLNSSNKMEVDIGEEFEIIPLKSQENFEQYYTPTDDDDSITNCTDSWNFERTRSYSVPRDWRPLERRFND